MADKNEISLTAVELLERFRETVERLNTQLINLTADSSSDLVTQYLDIIETHIAKAEEFLQEEAFAEFVTFSGEAVKITNVPDGLTLTPREGGVRINGIPLWLVANVSHRKSQSNYHQNRPWVRRSTWWHELVHYLKHGYLSTVWKHESLLPDKPPSYAHVILKFRTSSSNVRDLDHYSVSPLINALVSNRLLISDHPKRLTYTTIWQNEIGSDELEVDVQYCNSEPFYLGNELSL